MASFRRGADAHGRIGRVGCAAHGAGGLRAAVCARGRPFPGLLDTKYVCMYEGFAGVVGTEDVVGGGRTVIGGCRDGVQVLAMF